MGPSAVETSIATDRPHVNLTVKLTGGIGPYKELSPIGYEKEAEEKGRDGFEPAKVDKHPVHSQSHALQ
jgi:sulfonate dioxygenase